MYGNVARHLRVKSLSKANFGARKLARGGRIREQVGRRRKGKREVCTSCCRGTQIKGEIRVNPDGVRKMEREGWRRPEGGGAKGERDATDVISHREQQRGNDSLKQHHAFVDMHFSY